MQHNPSLQPAIVKPWGCYTNLMQDHNCLVKLIEVLPGETLSLQSHQHRGEHWYIVAGVALVERDSNRFTLATGETIHIPKEAKHRLSNPGTTPLAVLEIQYGDTLSEEDIVRYKDRYGRALGAAQMKTIREIQAPAVIAEVGCNHQGNLETAIEMIRIAAQFCRVSVVKFQKRSNRELLTPEEYNGPHPNPINSYGNTYGAHREFLEFDLEQHRTLKAACDEWGVIYSTSVWDATSTREIISLNPELIKVPSAINTDYRVLDLLFSDYGGQIHISLGMTTAREIEQLMERAAKRNRLKDTVLYHCISGYPVDNRELYLMEIPKLVARYGKDLAAIGFSGHHRGIAVDIAALTLGATWFERHFTLDRTLKGTDHAASLEPDGLRRLMRDLQAAQEALHPKPQEILAIEEVQRKKLKRFSEPSPTA